MRIVIGVCLLGLAIIDLKTRKIPNHLTVLFAMVVGCVFLCGLWDAAQNGLMVEHLIMAAFGVSFSALISLWLYVMRAIAAGDVKIIAPVGTVLGVQGVIDWLVASIIIGGIVGVVVLSVYAVRKRGLRGIGKLQGAFIPCLFVGFVVSWIIG